MKIPLSKVKGLDRRVRKQMSPEKLDELAASIKDMGLIVPVKVRQNGDGYTLVYGHRRVAAAKMAGLKEIEAIVENVPEDALLTQALAENVIREDMAAIDIAKALQQIIDSTRCTKVALASKMGWNEVTVRQYLELLVPEIRKVMESNSSSLPYRHVGAAMNGTGDTKLAARVLEKAGREELTQRQTRILADATRQAGEFGGATAIKRVLAKPYAEIAAEQPTILPAKRYPAIRKTTGEFQVSWVKDLRVVAAEQALKDISALLAFMARSEKDPGGAKVVIKNLRRLALNVVDQMDRILERL